MDDAGSDGGAVTAPIRVLVVDGSDRGGIMRYSEMLCDELVAAGVDARLSTAAAGRSRGAPALPKIAWGDEVLGMGRARFYARRLVETARRSVALLVAVARVRPDVVHVQTGITARFDPILLTVLHRFVPIVATVHDVVPFEGGDAASDRQFDRLRHADVIVVHTPGDVDLVRRGLPGASVEVVRPASAYAAVPGGRAAARERLGLGDDPIVLLLGIMRPYKGIELLVRAWPAVHAARPDAGLWLVGSLFDPFADLDTLLGLPGVNGRIGWLEDEEMDLWAAAADVAVLPYTRGALSGVLQQAAANGTPVLVSDALAEEAERHGIEPLPYDAGAWTEGLLAALTNPPPPPAEPDRSRSGDATRAIYERLLPPHP